MFRGGAVRYKATPQVEADRRLLNFQTYEDYLDSLTNNLDDCYLQSTETSRTIAELGYRNSGETLTRKQFERRLAAVIQYLYPPYQPYISFSEGMTKGDPVHLDLALRERSNRVGILSTIIFLSSYNKAGFEVSAYIDYGERLLKEDWKPIFKGEALIVPKTSDLGYYRWRSGKVISNDSLNFKAMQDPKEGLVFKNRFDRRIIIPRQDPGANTTRKRIYSRQYKLVILFDHVVRQRI